MKIEIGKTYKARNGQVVGPMMKSERFIQSQYPFTVGYTLVADYGKGWREDGTFSPYGEPNDLDLVSEVLTLREGGYYLTAEGVVEGPMFLAREYWKSENPKTMQKHSRGCGQIWEDDGSVSVESPGEEGHRLVKEVPAPSQYSEIERLKAVIASQKEKLDRVQNIHANTIKTLRKARADVKKVNKALSEEQRWTNSLSERLAEVVKAATDAADYAKGIERTAPKKRRAIDKVDVGNSEVYSVESLKDLIWNDRSPSSLQHAFIWSSTPQGTFYWMEKRDGKKPINAADILFFKALLDKFNGAE